jgi:Fur family transcriptional regulator, iron response regulator
MRSGHNKKSEKDRLSSMLTQKGMRPTKQRLALASLLFGGRRESMHVTPEEVMKSVRKKKVNVSLATVYNCLNQFTESGLLCLVSIHPTCNYFDTNTAPHHHFLDSASGKLCDIPYESIHIGSMPSLPAGHKIQKIDVTIRLAKAA